MTTNIVIAAAVAATATVAVVAAAAVRTGQIWGNLLRWTQPLPLFFEIRTLSLDSPLDHMMQLFVIQLILAQKFQENSISHVNSEVQHKSGLPVQVDPFAHRSFLHPYGFWFWFAGGRQRM